MFCTECGSKIDAGWKFCQNCGNKLNGEAPASPAKSSNSGLCLPGKKYTVLPPQEAQNYKDFIRSSEVNGGNPGFYGNNFTVLEDGTLIGFKYGHTPKYQNAGAENFHYNLYRVTPDGVATFLNAGIHGSIESFYVLDNYAYCTHIATEMKARVDI